MTDSGAGSITPDTIKQLRVDENILPQTVQFVPVQPELGR